MTHEPSPLVDIFVQYVIEEIGDIRIDSQITLRTFIDSFFKNMISYEQACGYLKHLINSYSSLEKIKAILSVPDEPLPPSTESQEKKTHRWTSAEDLRLLAAVHRFGLTNWAQVAKFIGNSRTRSQAAQRWFRGLDPKISKEHWSSQEEEKLISLVSSIGSKGWTYISQQMGNRSDVQCRYHYMQMKKDAPFLVSNNHHVPARVSTSMSTGSIPVYNQGITIPPNEAMITPKSNRPIKVNSKPSIPRPKIAPGSPVPLPNRPARPKKKNPADIFKAFRSISP